MKKIKLAAETLTLTAIIFYAGFSNSAELKILLFPGSETTVKGINFQPNTELTIETSTGNPVKGTLGSGEYSTSGISWKPNTQIAFDEYLNVTSGTVESGSIAGFKIKPGSNINFYPTTRTPVILQLTEDTKIDEFVYATINTNVEFYPNGSIRSATLRDPFDYTVPGTDLKMYFKSGAVIYYPYQAKSTEPSKLGALRQASLRLNSLNPLTWDSLFAGTTITLDGRGRITRLYSDTTTIQYRQITFPQKSNIQVTDEGLFTVLSITPFKVKDKTYPAFKPILLDPDGQVVAGNPIQ